MADHPTPLEEEDIIEQTIHRELARQKLPSARSQAVFEPEDSTAEPPGDGHEAPAPAARWSARLLPCFTVLFGAAFCILLVAYLFQLRQNNARYTQLEEDLASIESMLQTRDPMAQEIGELEQEVYILTESNSALYDRLQETTMEAMAFRILCYGEIYLNTRDYYNATLAVMTIPIAEMIRYWEEYDSFHQQYSTTDSPAFLPRYQHLLDVLTAKDYLIIEPGEDGTLTASYGEAAMRLLASDSSSEGG